jgi:hypothetical protein
VKACAFLLGIGVATAQVHFNPVSREVVEQRLRAFTAKNATREPALRKLFEEAGCTGDALSDQSVKGSPAPNLICDHPGALASTIVVGAHFDLVERGQGVVDNWTGVALLPSLYQGLIDISRQHRFVFVGFTGEEKDMSGSKWYVKQLGPGPTGVKAMVNMDTLGLSETKVWAHRADPELVRILRVAAASMKLPLEGMNVDGVGSTDSESFLAKKIPAITIHSLTPETLPVLHSSKDTIEAVHLDEYYRTYRLILGYLALLDQKLD